MGSTFTAFTAQAGSTRFTGYCNHDASGKDRSDKKAKHDC